MPTLPIPFTPLNKSADKPTLTTFNQGQFDGFWQEYLSPDGPKFIWAKRPGLTAFSSLGVAAPVDGVHFWTRQSKAIAVCNGRVFALTSAGVASEITGTATMTASVRPTFADVAGSALYIASSGAIGAYPSSGTGAYLADGDAPTTVRFIGTINQILVALRDNSERFDWADALDPTSWSGLYANAEAQPDLAKALLIANAYIYLPGQDTTEVWADDGTTFVKESQGAISRGTLAAYSVVNINGQIYSLDSTYEVSRLVGFVPEVISNPALSRYLRSFSTVSDAIGEYLPIEGRHFYMLSFPTEKRTLVYDIGVHQWYEWSYWDSAKAEHTAYIGRGIVVAPAWNKVLAGDRATGLVYTVGGTTDNGDTIRTVLQTDFIDRGVPDTYKVSHELMLVFKRADTATTPKTMLLNWRDEGNASWSDSHEVAIEAAGKTELFVHLRRLGKYKRRQWRFVMSDATQAALLTAMERFSIGR